MTKSHLSRRSFLATCGAGAAAAMASAAEPLPSEEPNADIRVGVIGLRGRGGNHIQGFGQHVVALCDVDQKVLAGWQERLTRGDPPRRVETYTDFRRLLERTDIDAISIATPNHTHALIGILAAQAGKHVYVEKPVSQTIWEGRQLVNAASRYGRVIQCGTQSRSSPALHEAQKFVADGQLGKIQYALGTCYKRRPSIGLLPQPLKIPDYIDYELWCGPVEPVPLYRPQFHYDWHWDFHTGCGDLGNQGIHQTDVARWFLGETQLAPRVMSVGGRLGYKDAGNTPNTQIVLHAYEKAPLLFEVRGLPQRSGSEEMDNYRGVGVGVLVQCETGHVLVPSYVEAIAYDVDGQEIQHWRNGNDQLHYDNFLAAVAARDASLLNAPVLEGHISSALCHAGNVSYRLGEPQPIAEVRHAVRNDELLAESVERLVEHLAANGVTDPALQLGPWLDVDPPTEQFLNSGPANELLHRVDRESFAVPNMSV